MVTDSKWVKTLISGEPEKSEAAMDPKTHIIKYMYIHRY